MAALETSRHMPGWWPVVQLSSWEWGLVSTDVPRTTAEPKQTLGFPMNNSSLFSEKSHKNYLKIHSFKQIAHENRVSLQNQFNFNLEYYLWPIYNWWHLKRWTSNANNPSPSSPSSWHDTVHVIILDLWQLMNCCRRNKKKWRNSSSCFDTRKKTFFLLSIRFSRVWHLYTGWKHFFFQSSPSKCKHTKIKLVHWSSDFWFVDRHPIQQIKCVTWDQ